MNSLEKYHEFKKKKIYNEYKQFTKIQLFDEKTYIMNTQYIVNLVLANAVKNLMVLNVMWNLDDLVRVPGNYFD